MMPEDRYCGGCGIPLELQILEGVERPLCPQCGRVVYYDPKLAATAVVERAGLVLMLRRAGEPGYGLWSLPGGYVDRGEVVEEAAAREVQEETGLQVQVNGLVGLFSEEGHPVVVAAYMAMETGGNLEAGPEALELGFHPLDALPPLAFPRDRLILDSWQSLKDGKEASSE